MSLLISNVFTYDEDAGNYIQAVEAADTQALEPATRKAINNFVIGCKQDGIWTAIKASCILSGSRTLAGALVPLAGTAPTNIGGLFISGDYNRKTGLKGNGSSKALNSNRSRSADPINSFHCSVYSTTTIDNAIFGVRSNSQSDHLLAVNATAGPAIRGRSVSIDFRVTGFIGTSNTASELTARSAKANFTNTGALYASFADSNTYWVFARNLGTNAAVSSGSPSVARLAFYSIGESLDLALLDARVTDLINAFAVTIP
jgi:hypothetical protein